MQRIYTNHQTWYSFEWYCCAESHEDGCVEVKHWAYNVQQIIDTRRRDDFGILCHSIYETFNWNWNEPASMSKTRQCGTSDNLDAITEPPLPPPTTMKSYSVSGAARLYTQKE